jgi:hypothetical protein
MKPFSTLFELNIHHVLKLIGMALYEDTDHEGLQLFLTSLTEDLQDDKYTMRVKELQALSAKVPSDKLPHEWSRELNFKHMAAIIACVRRHGYLDSAPIAEGDSGAEWLAV